MAAPTSCAGRRFPTPIPGPGEVRIRVEVAGVHRIDTAIRAGQVDGPPAAELPATPGREVAGTVDALGTGVDESWIGTRVVAHLGAASRGYAELAVAPVAALHAPTLAADRQRLRTYEERALSTMAAGAWDPLMTTFPLRDAAAAHRAIDARSAIGKVVLVA